MLTLVQTKSNTVKAGERTQRLTFFRIDKGDGSVTEIDEAALLDKLHGVYKNPFLAVQHCKEGATLENNFAQYKLAHVIS